jgi:hypothetical protein
MNIYEHGIAAESDEWEGSLRLLASTDLPIYSGFSLAILDFESQSLNERAAHLGHVNGPCYRADYFEEADLRYSVLATLYHLNRLIDLYVALTQLFEKTYPPGTASLFGGGTKSVRVYAEGALEALWDRPERALALHSDCLNSN